MSISPPEPSGRPFDPALLSAESIGDLRRRMEHLESLPAFSRIPMAWVIDRKSAGSNGGDFTSGAWRIRDLTNIHYDPYSLVSDLSSNTFQLISGKYFLWAWAPAYEVNKHRIRLRGSVQGLLQIGTGSLADDGNREQSNAIVQAIFDADGSEYFEIDHYCQTTRTAAGFGVNMTFGVAEVFTTVALLRMGD